jgi:hypothetical protein
MLPRLGDVLRIVIEAWDLVLGDHGTWLERVELVERADPFEARLRVGFRRGRDS